MRHDKTPTLVFDPRGIVDTTITPLASRKPGLNANRLLRGASAAMSQDSGFAAVNYYVKQSFSKDAAPDLIERIARENDIVLTAIGDCGSCCSCCIRDAVALERLGIPSAAIITAEFVRETELTRRALGMPDLVPVVIDHPVSSITQEEIEARVLQIRQKAEKIWIAG